METIFSSIESSLSENPLLIKVVSPNELIESLKSNYSKLSNQPISNWFTLDNFCVISFLSSSCSACYQYAQLLPQIQTEWQSVPITSQRILRKTNVQFVYVVDPDVVKWNKIGINLELAPSAFLFKLHFNKSATPTTPTTPTSIISTSSFSSFSSSSSSPSSLSLTSSAKIITFKVFIEPCKQLVTTAPSFWNFTNKSNLSTIEKSTIDTQTKKNATILNIFTKIPLPLLSCAELRAVIYQIQKISSQTKEKSIRTLKVSTYNTKRRTAIEEFKTKILFLDPKLDFKNQPLPSILSSIKSLLLALDEFSTKMPGIVGHILDSNELNRTTNKEIEREVIENNDKKILKKQSQLSSKEFEKKTTQKKRQVGNSFHFPSFTPFPQMPSILNWLPKTQTGQELANIFKSWQSQETKTQDLTALQCWRKYVCEEEARKRTKETFSINVQEEEGSQHSEYLQFCKILKSCKNDTQQENKKEAKTKTKITKEPLKSQSKVKKLKEKIHGDSSGWNSLTLCSLYKHLEGISKSKLKTDLKSVSDSYSWLLVQCLNVVLFQ